MAETIGLDRTEHLLERWVAETWQRDARRVEAALQLLWASELGVYPREYTPENIKESGRRYLYFRTHFLSYSTCLEEAQQHVADLRAVIAAALGISGCRVSLPIEVLNEKHCMLVEGTNLFLNPAAAPSAAAILLDGDAGRLAFGMCEVAATFSADRIVAGPAEASWYVTLPCDADFVYCFSEELTNRGLQRTLIRSVGQIATAVQTLSEARSFLQTRFPAVWNCVRQQLTYVNWTSVPYFESSTDLRLPRGAITLNPRVSELQHPAERQAWLINGLYHEAKHTQFLATFPGVLKGCPGIVTDQAACFSHSQLRIPCAWKSRPCLRNVAEHFFALHGFVLGWIPTFARLAGEPQMSRWLADQVEVDMRSINGGMGAMSLAEPLMTATGRQIWNVLRTAYTEFLIPAFERIDAVRWES